MKDCIQDFITSWQQYDGRQGIINGVTWNSRLSDAGYHRVECSQMSEWNDVHTWCEDTFGKSHYAWVGSVFWFECKENALLFQLKWI